jgi:hypothetical protein
MARLLIAIAVGVLLGVGAAAIATNALSGLSDGTPSNATLYVYGNR